MKQFFKFMFASMAGFMLAGFLFIIFMIFILSGIVSSVSTETKVVISKNSILEVTLDKTIEERTSNNPFDEFDFSRFTSEKNPGLNDILKNIDKASRDENIKGIFLNLSRVPADLATLEEVRNALLDFKKSGKFMIAYGEDLSQSAYYLASTADKIYLHPEGSIDFRGFRTELMFFKGALEKLEIEPEVIRHGKFKSAVEPFINDKMSPENKEQITRIIRSFWNTYLENIAASRNTDIVSLQKVADDLSTRSAKGALETGMVDELAYFDQVQERLQELSGSSAKSETRMISLRKYNKVFVKSRDYSRDKIAMIYAVGDIVSGEGTEEQVGSERIAETIRKARLDSSIKAIVFRVNSPGGSAIASDVVWREALLAKKAKPFVVSMGDYAASGGYYISCAADTIVAQPNTLTGSIGVFGLLMNAQKMFNNKLGITFDSVKTGRYADIGTFTRRLSAEEKDIIQSQVEDTYETFIRHVSEGRRLDKSFVDSIGQGRIWSGVDAKQLGLVDVIGGINTAVDIAARMARLDNYRIIQLPQQKEIFEKLLEDLNTETSTYFAKKELGEQYHYYEKLKAFINNNGIQARIPFELDVY